MTDYYYRVDAKRHGKFARSNVVKVPLRVVASETYGPTNGRQSVINGAAPRTVADPGGGVSFSTAAGLETAIAANPSNTIFVPSVASIDWDRRILVTNKHPRIFCPGLPADHIMDAGDRALFSMIGGGAANDDMEIYGGTWRNVTDPGGGGHVIAAGGASVIRDVDVNGGVKSGIRISGSNVEVGYSKIHDNDLSGLTNPGLGSGTSVHHVEFFGNGFADPDGAPDDGGSGKWSGGSAAAGTIELCYMHESSDYGPWNDGAGAWTIRENVMEDCRKAAPFLEIMTTGSGEVSHNWLARNGEAYAVSPGGGEWFISNVLTVACCDPGTGKEIFVHNNHIEGAVRLLAVNNQQGRTNTKRLRVVNNRFKITASTARVGGQDSQTSGSRTMHLETPSNGGTFVWDNNLYQLSGSLFDFTRFPTSSTDAGSDQTWAQWQALGFDVNSTRETF